MWKFSTTLQPPSHREMLRANIEDMDFVIGKKSEENDFVSLIS